MALPSVHRCLQLGAENEQLLRKMKKLQRKNKELEEDLAQIQGEGRQRQLARGHVTSRDVQIQTDTHVWRKGGYSKNLNLEGESARLLQLYSNLQKCYVKEMKTNQEQSETIRNLTMKICELEHSLQEQKQRIEQLERNKVLWKTHAVSGKRSRTLGGEIVSHRDTSKKEESCCSKYIELLLKEIKKLKKENEKLSEERRALRKELAGLDKEFFQEIEDLKRAVQESVKLNNQYEKCLKQISVIFGLPFTAHL
ncbi:centrosomal protein of 290 kDa-like isoform X1 [Centrocercus urophasianus]|uniref:centrosomal protein of 290 kDa-like isoform X1 n=1 Tax=Centrocercus urophasianus TaxID=9002 RepID=UPI001C649BE4|nr:centrosomal protein of 290 kDa-like isoform X1 [Centrocercus urophasianus]